jgi:hypothetical protein
MWFIVLTSCSYTDETTFMASRGKFSQSTELEAGHALLSADLGNIGGPDPAGMILATLEILGMLEQCQSRAMLRAFGKAEDRQDADPATAHRQFKMFNDRGTYSQQAPQRSVSNIHRSRQARDGYSGNMQKVRDQIPNLDETQTVQEWANHLVALILAFLRYLAAGRKALAALDTDVELVRSPDKLEQLDDQPPLALAAICTLIAAPAAPPRLLTAA